MGRKDRRKKTVVAETRSSPLAMRRARHSAQHNASCSVKRQPARTK